MKVVLQRVSYGKVIVKSKIIGEISQGFVLLIGISKDDNEEKVSFIADKVINLRVFSDDNGKMNLSLKDVNGEILAVSQFTLYGDTKKGRRPSFTEAADPEKAKYLYDFFVEKLKSSVSKVETGIFGAEMEVEIHNDGPVTFILEN
ncbi:MAG: D-aminoacyl-tRNA deacylase [Candidatus Sericytochromatia bacterium]|nr:MAG: D-aminoacyl-tRNA deacylase [Candidatus Sericytochromatia bacterium]